jgi:hypothetical protein
MSGNGKQRREKVHLQHDNPNVRVSGRRVVKEGEKVLWKKEKPKPIPGSGTGRRIQYMPTEMDKKLAGAMKRKRDEEEEEEEAEDQEIDYEEEDDEEEEGLGAAPQPALVPRAAPPQAAQSAAGPSAGPRAQFSIRGSAVVTLAESFTGVSADNIHLVPRHSAAAGSRATEVRYTQFINR